MNTKYRAAELEYAFNQAMEYCKECREPPVDFVLHKFTDISNDTMQNYVKWAEEMEKGDREVDLDIVEASAAIKKWWEFKTYFWVALGLNNEKLAAFTIFNLKQPCNGGYSDKQVGSVGNIEVVVKGEGVGGEKAFG